MIQASVTVKVQIALETCRDVPDVPGVLERWLQGAPADPKAEQRCLIYDKDRVHMWEGPTPPALAERMEGRVKAFFTANLLAGIVETMVERGRLGYTPDISGRATIVGGFLLLGEVDDQHW